MTTPGPFLYLLAVALAFSGCATCPTTCVELETAMDEKFCPERVETRTVETFQPLDLQPKPTPPPITAAAVPDETAATDPAAVLRALAWDLQKSREWGWTLYYQIDALEVAAAALEEGGTPP